MAGNTQMNESERGVFKLHGITGLVLFLVLLLSILVVLVTNSLIVQQNESKNFYKINQDLNGLKMISSENHKQYQLVGSPK